MMKIAGARDAGLLYRIDAAGICRVAAPLTVTRPRGACCAGKIA